MSRPLPIFAAVLLIGCAQKQMVAPSGAGVSSGIGRTQMSVEQAKRSNDLAIVHNAKGQTLIQRIEAKTSVIQKYWDRSK